MKFRDDLNSVKTNIPSSTHHIPRSIDDPWKSWKKRRKLLLNLFPAKFAIWMFEPIMCHEIRSTSEFAFTCIGKNNSKISQSRGRGQTPWAYQAVPSSNKTDRYALWKDSFPARSLSSEFQRSPASKRSASDHRAGMTTILASTDPFCDTARPSSYYCNYSF